MKTKLTRLLNALLAAWLIIFSAHSALAIALGDRVQTTSSVNVRSSAAGAAYATGQSSGALGVTIGGPTTATLNGTSYIWWNINFANDRDRAERMLSQVRSGSVYWNCCDRVSPRLPWSGVGDSGIGLTLSTYGIEAFTRPKAWHLRGG